MLFAGALVLLAACGGAKKDVTSAGFDTKKQYVLSFGTTSDLQPGYQAVIDSAQFKSKCPNIFVKLSVADWQTHHDRLTTVIAAGQAPNDIEAIDTAYLGKFMNTSAMTDLNAAPFNAKSFTGALVSYAVQNGTTVDGKLLAIPVDTAPGVLLYRKDLADKAGVSFENLASWDEFISACRKVMDKVNTAGQKKVFGLPHPADAALATINGGLTGLVDENGNPLAPKDKFIKALQLAKKVRDAKIDGDLSSWSDPWQAAFTNGQIITSPNGAWFVGQLQLSYATEEKGLWRMTYLPEDKWISFGGSYLAIPAKVPADNKPAAWEVVKYFTASKDAQLSNFNSINSFPVMTALYTDPVMAEPVEYLGGQKARQIVVDVAKNTKPDRITAGDAAIQGILINAINAVAAGADIEKAYADALAQAKEAVQ
jgi:multiple sugar transport system substrate-binding protein